VASPQQFAGLKAALGERYVLEREIGHGGMSTVYLAEDAPRRRKVAVKVLRMDISQVGRQRFLREIEIASQLTHPHILPVHDSGEADGSLYYVTPYLEGESLRDRFKREGQLPVHDALRLASEVADALTYAHRRGFVHRDIKPENILLSDGHAVVADFGLARALTLASEERLTVTGISVGTPAYMSPEQALSDRDVDGRTDIYALGCVLYEMLAGEPPFTGSTAQAILAKKLVDEPLPLRTLRSTVPVAVERAVARALAKTPADRFPTTEEFVAALGVDSATDLTDHGLTSRQRLARLAMAAAAIATLVLVARSLIPGPGPALDANRVVVFPLTATDPELNRLDAGLDVALAIGAALEHSDPLRWIDGWSRLGEAARSDARLITAGVARAISRDRRARFYLDGVIRRESDTMAVTVRLHDASADSLVAQETVSGPLGEATAAALGIGALVRILPRLVDPGSTVDLSPLTERRPRAVALAIQGAREYRRAKFTTALGFFRRALSEDPHMVYAAVKAAQAASWSNRLGEAERLASIAVAGDSLLPEKYQDFAHGLAALFAGVADSAVARFRSALARDAEWSEAWMALGEVYYHLLPSAAPLDTLAESSFMEASAIDTTFSPPLVHLAEMAVLKGDVRGAAKLVTRLQRGEPDTTIVRQLELMIECVNDPAGFDWKRAVAEDPAAVILAAKTLGVAGQHPQCAGGGFGEIFWRTDLDPGYRWAGLLGLYGILLAQGKYDEAITAVDSAVATRLSAAYSLYVFGELAGAPFHARADAAERIARDGAGENYDRVSRPENRFLLAVWNGRRAGVDKLRTIAARERQTADSTGSARTRLRADALDAHLAFARGDIAGAIVRLMALRPVEPASSLAWSDVGCLAIEHALLTELLFRQGRFEEAYRAATVFDHPGPVLYLPFLPRSLVIRRDAATALNRPELARRYADRLAALGWRSLRHRLLISTNPPTKGGLRDLVDMAVAGRGRDPGGEDHPDHPLAA
jgi:tetratricopeptide (TPR) repeat protein